MNNEKNSQKTKVINSEPFVGSLGGNSGGGKEGSRDESSKGGEGSLLELRALHGHGKRGNGLLGHVLANRGESGSAGKEGKEGENSLHHGCSLSGITNVCFEELFNSTVPADPLAQLRTYMSRTFQLWICFQQNLPIFLFKKGISFFNLPYASRVPP